MKYTQGKWLLTTLKEELTVISEDGRIICKMSILPERDTNARLIAAAKELLEALKRMAYYHDHLEAINPEYLRFCLSAARRAIAAAEGSEPEEEHTGEPDPTDLAREFQDAQDDAEQPTPYDP